MSQQPRFTCILTPADVPDCPAPARVTVVDPEGGRGRACVPHALEALRAIRGARVDWDDSKGLNDMERKALQLAEGGAR